MSYFYIDIVGMSELEITLRLIAEVENHLDRAEVVGELGTEKTNYLFYRSTNYACRVL